MSSGMTGWRPIETAPKDGTWVRLWIEHRKELGHDPSYSHETKGQWIDFNGGGWTWSGVCGTPTHWAPLKKHN